MRGMIRGDGIKNSAHILNRTVDFNVESHEMDFRYQIGYIA